MTNSNSNNMNNSNSNIMTTYKGEMVRETLKFDKSILKTLRKARKLRSKWLQAFPGFATTWYIDNVRKSDTMYDGTELSKLILDLYDPETHRKVSVPALRVLNSLVMNDLLEEYRKAFKAVYPHITADTVKGYELDNFFLKTSEHVDPSLVAQYVHEYIDATPDWTGFPDYMTIHGMIVFEESYYPLGGDTPDDKKHPVVASKFYRNYLPASKKLKELLDKTSVSKQEIADWIDQGSAESKLMFPGGVEDFDVTGNRYFVPNLWSGSLVVSFSHEYKK